MTPPRVHVVGRRNQGKTTLVVELVEHLTRAGVQVATVKHSGHDHQLDRPGKDSYRHRLAGGCPTAFVTPQGTAVVLPPTRDPYGPLHPLFRGRDLVLVEGDLDAAGVTKVEVFRAGLGHADPLAAQRDDISLVITDDPIGGDVPTCPRADVELAARQILRLASRPGRASCFVQAGGRGQRLGGDKTGAWWRENRDRT